MADVFVRRTTAFLLFLVFALAVTCVAILVLFLRPQNQEEVAHKELSLKHQQSAHPAQMDITSSRPLMKLKLSTSPPTTTTLTVPTTTITTPFTTGKQMTPISTTPSKMGKKMHPWEKNIRIPKSTIPYHYDLRLHPDFETARFNGSISILIGVTSPMDYLLTHVKLMNVTSTKLYDDSGLELELKEAFEYTENQFWVVRPAITLSPGNYTLFMSFNGGLKGHIVGFYMSEYLTKSGERK